MEGFNLKQGFVKLVGDGKILLVIGLMQHILNQLIVKMNNFLIGGSGGDHSPILPVKIYLQNAELQI